MQDPLYSSTKSIQIVQHFLWGVQNHCSNPLQRPILAQKSRGNSVLGVVYSHTLEKKSKNAYEKCKNENFEKNVKTHFLTLDHMWTPLKIKILHVFQNFHFYTFHRHFKIFSLYNISKFLVSSYRSQFFTQECDIWVEKPLYHKKLKTFEFF